MSTRLQSLFGRLLRDPLLHFLLIGAGIYVAYGLSEQPATETAERTLTVTAGEVAWLEESWLKRWNRPPTAEERDGLIRQYVRETVLYREALAMGLDEDDTVVRRRLAQKLEFLSNDLLQPQPPDDEVLRAYFEANEARYRSPDLITMTQVFFDPDRRGDQTLADAAAAKAALEARGAPAFKAGTLGDPFLLQGYYPERSEAELSKLFGSGFAEAVFDLAPETWHAPVLSGYGTHVVYVHERRSAPTPAFTEVRDFVEKDWTEERRKELNDQFVTTLQSRYTVVVEDGREAGETTAEQGQSR